MSSKDKMGSETLMAARAGDAEAFEHLVGEYYGMVYKLLYRWCGVREEAEDLAQEVFMKLPAKLGDYRGEAGFKTWLYRIAINHAKDKVKSEVRSKMRERAFALEQEGASDNEPDNPCSIRELHLALEQIPEDQKAAVLLVYAEGMSHKEAAEALGCAETTVSWRLFRARQKLKGLLAPKGDK